MKLNRVKNDIPVWSVSREEFLRDSKIDLNRGLSEEESRERLQAFGPNLLQVEKERDFLPILIRQFKSPVILILIFATIISFALGETVDAVAIVTIVILNAFIGFFQELKAENAVAALKKMTAPKGKVLRDGKIHEVSAADVVPGDLLFLEAGDFVPADARLVQAHQVSCEEAVLTGESLPVSKRLDAVNALAALGDRKNMLFAGTALATGTAKAIVTSTGLKTEIGKIASLLEKTTQGRTPLQKRLEEVSGKLLIACGLVVVLVAILGIFHGESWLEIGMTAISLSVAAIPEGLATVVSLALALAVRRMSRKNAIVKHLPAVETLGSTSVICTDKTGTLTTGKMRSREVFTLNLGLSDLKSKVDGLEDLITSSVLCSNAAPNAQGEFSGDPTEVALLLMAEQQGYEIKAIAHESPRIYEWSFDSDRKRMSVAHNHQGKVIIHTKGAPESVLAVSTMNEGNKKEILKAIESLSQQGRRILAVARKVLPGSLNDFDSNLYSSWSEIEIGLEFLGLVAIADPPRQESIQAVADCRAAGVKVVMITGDHPVTAAAIAKELGILDDHFNQILTGSDLETMTDKELKGEVEKVAVYARVSPEHKLRIVRAWQSLGHTVAMTGDGVNDAPALKQATIGVSMGRGGTEVARQASSMILTDDNFATIVAAVEEGRAIYGNIRRTIQYLLSGNLAEILIMLGAAIAGWPMPLAPIHLLWINLVTDGLPSLALAAEPVPRNFLKSTQRPSRENFFDRFFYREMILIGVIIGVLSLVLYGYGLKYRDEATAKTYVFTYLVFAELFRSFACRSETRTFFQLGIFSNLYHLAAVLVPMTFQIVLLHFPAIQNVFKVRSLGWDECVPLIAMTVLPVSLLEIRKWLLGRRNRPQGR